MIWKKYIEWIREVEKNGEEKEMARQKGIYG